GQGWRGTDGALGGVRAGPLFEWAPPRHLKMTNTRPGGIPAASLWWREQWGAFDLPQRNRGFPWH
ncbi:MAG: hypothetical protein ACOVRM_15340, partial [Planctomycetaceae bacterium]